MNEMQSRILKAAADFGQVRESQLGSARARAEMAALEAAGYVVMVSDGMIAELEAATAHNGIEGDAQGDSLRREARSQRGSYVLTPRGEAWANANGCDTLTHSFIDFLYATRRQPQTATSSIIAEAEEVIEAANDNAAYVTATEAARQFSVPAGVLVAACKSRQIERAEVRDGKWYAPSGSFWAYAQQYHYDGR